MLANTFYKYEKGGKKQRNSLKLFVVNVTG